MTAVELCDVSVGYRVRGRAHTVAAGLTARARRGELTVLLGPNGVGKSTLLRTIAGMQRSLAGTITLDGTPLPGIGRDELARRVAVVLTERIDGGFLTGFDLAALGRTPHLGLGGALRPADREIVTGALRHSDASKLADRPVAEMSDGERQRVLTARALAQQPGLLVLDEPTAFLDVPSRVALMAMLRKLAGEQNLAVLVSTHDLELALRLADRVWLMDRDARLHDAAPETLTLNGAIGDTFSREDLRFDIDTAVFALDPVPAAGRLARVTGSGARRHAVERVLGRAGWTVGAGGDADLALRVGERLTLRHDGTRREIGTFDELAEIVRGLPSATVRVSDPAAVAAALADVAEVTPYFACTAGNRDGDGWQPLTKLYTDGETLTAAARGVANRIGAGEFRVGLSTLQMGLVARLASITLGCVRRAGRLPDLDPDTVWWRSAEGAVRLHIDEPEGWCGEGMEQVAVRQLVEDHLRPLAAACRGVSSLSQHVLWGNAASAMFGAAAALQRAGTLGVRETAAHWVGSYPRLRAAVEDDGDAERPVRRSCCLYYRVSARTCSDCPLPTAPETQPRKAPK